VHPASASEGVSDRCGRSPATASRHDCDTIPGPPSRFHRPLRRCPRARRRRRPREFNCSRHWHPPLSLAPMEIHRQNRARDGRRTASAAHSRSHSRTPVPTSSSTTTPRQDEARRTVADIERSAGARRRAGRRRPPRHPPLVVSAVRTFGRLDILVNSASLFERRPCSRSPRRRGTACSAST
jgi:hypothetical protein